MHTSTLYPLLSLLVGTTTLAQTTTTATILIPDWCITQSAPTVTVINRDRDLTTYSYSCSVDSSAMSSASAKANSIAGDAKSRASAKVASAGLKPTWVPGAVKRDNDCYGWNNGWGYNSWEACIPWEITQGASVWAVHYTATGVVALDQECSFGAGGVYSGAATCTASGRLDPGVWGGGEGPRTHTFSRSDVDRFWVKDVVSVTGGGGGYGAGVAASSTGTAAGVRQTGLQGNNAVQSTGGGMEIAMPSGLVAIGFGAGGILVAALAL